MRLNFANEDSHSAFHAMCEGMAEIARDNDESALATQLEGLINETGAPVPYAPVPYPASFPIRQSLWNAIRLVVENMRDAQDEDACGITIDPNVFDYFAAKLGVEPNDESLRELSIDSPCGRDCVGMIDWTAECIARAPANLESKWIVQDLINSCNESCEVYWRG